MWEPICRMALQRGDLNSSGYLAARRAGGLMGRLLSRRADRIAEDQRAQEEAQMKETDEGQRGEQETGQGQGNGMEQGEQEGEAADGCREAGGAAAAGGAGAGLEFQRSESIPLPMPEQQLGYVLDMEVRGGSLAPAAEPGLWRS
jgi:hypothetical protein